LLEKFPEEEVITLNSHSGQFCSKQETDLLKNQIENRFWIGV
jgi:hypothetical protein